MSLPWLLTITSAIIFLVVERVRPGRPLPNSKGWYFRAILINTIQLLITVSIGSIWHSLYGSHSLFSVGSVSSPLAQGFIAWFVGTFIFYWWHRIRHVNGFWQIFHQIHHSPSRIEIVTSFYKHPVEILVNTLLTAVILFPLLGCTPFAGAWYNFFAATGEFFYHGNYKSPHWLRYFIQTPELHSIHHQLDVHKHNYSDIPIWDRIFGTYKDATEFMERCGFPDHNEERLPEMLVFRDVYN